MAYVKRTKITCDRPYNGRHHIGICDCRYEYSDVYCDDCAYKGRVPFEDDSHGIPGHMPPWTWHARWDAPCDECGVPCEKETHNDCCR